MMPPEQLDLVLELTIERLAAKKKKELTRQELLRWIGVCMLIASINFRGKRRKLWEGGGAASKYLPSYDLRATGMSRNRFDDISGMPSGGHVNHPSSQSPSTLLGTVRRRTRGAGATRTRGGDTLAMTTARQHNTPIA